MGSGTFSRDATGEKSPYRLARGEYTNTDIALSCGPRLDGQTFRQGRGGGVHHTRVLLLLSVRRRRRRLQRMRRLRRRRPAGFSPTDCEIRNKRSSDRLEFFCGVTI